MKYQVEKTFREKPKYKRYTQGGFYETDDTQRAEHLQREGYIGDEINNTKTKSGRGKSNAGKGKSDDPGGDVNESSEVEPKDTLAKAE